MYKDLPSSLQKRVKQYLISNEFQRAKALHDAWVAKKNERTVQH